MLEERRWRVHADNSQENIKKTWVLSAFFCIPSLLFGCLFICLSLSSLFYNQEGMNFSTLFFALSICLCVWVICVFVAINIVQQSRRPKVSYLFLFVSMWLLPYFSCWSLMDHHVSVLSPTSISLWTWLSFRYEGVLCKGQKHSRRPKLDNSKKHRVSTIVTNHSMNLSFFSITLNLHHQIPFSAHFFIVCCRYPPLSESSWMHLWFPLLV